MFLAPVTMQGGMVAFRIEPSPKQEKGANDRTII
jgi:hypothetical protein